VGPLHRDDRDHSPFSLRRVAAASVLLLMAALYVTPVEKYLHSGDRMRTDKAQVAALQQRHDQLQAELAALQTKPQIIVLARACGWVFPNEHPLVIRDLPPGSATNCS
jgi:hypothetical protein